MSKKVEAELNALYEESNILYFSGSERRDELIERMLSLTSDTVFPEWHVRALLFKSDILHLQGKPKDRIELAQRALEVSRQNKLESQEASSLYFLGSMYIDYQQLTKAYECLSTALSIYKVHEDHRMEAAVNCGLGLLYGTLIDIEQAVKHSQRAIELFERIENWSGLGQVYTNLATLYFDIKDHERAITLYRKSRSYAERANDLVSMSISSSHIGRCFIQKQEFGLAIHELEHSIEYLKKFDAGTPVQAYTLARLSWCHAQLNQAVEAGDYLQRLMVVQDDETHADGLSEAWPTSAETLELLGRHDEAREMFLRALKRPKLMVNQQASERVFEGLARIFAAEGDHKSALEYQEELAVIRQTRRAKVVNDAIQVAADHRSVLHSEHSANLKDNKLTHDKAKNSSEQLMERLIQSQTRSNNIIKTIHSELERELPHTRGTARRLAGNTIKLIRKAMADRQELAPIDGLLTSNNQALIKLLCQKTSKLTPTELRICVLISMSLRSKEIAGSMYVSPETIKTHRKHIRQKLNLPTGQNLNAFLTKLAEAEA